MDTQLQYKVLQVSGSSTGLEKDLNALAKDGWLVDAANNTVVILFKGSPTTDVE